MQVIPIFFAGLPNPTDYSSTWNATPPAPKDNFDQKNDYWNTMIALKRINTTDARQVIQKKLVLWNTYDMDMITVDQTLHQCLVPLIYITLTSMY